jgi:hypothetical protein
MRHTYTEQLEVLADELAGMCDFADALDRATQSLQHTDPRSPRT